MLTIAGKITFTLNLGDAVAEIQEADTTFTLQHVSSLTVEAIEDALGYIAMAIEDRFGEKADSRIAGFEYGVSRMRPGRFDETESLTVEGDALIEGFSIGESSQAIAECAADGYAE